MSSMRLTAAFVALTLSQVAAAAAALSGWLRWAGTVPADYAGPAGNLTAGERVNAVTGLGTLLPMFDYSATGSFETARSGDARTALLVGNGARLVIAAIVVINLYVLFATRRRARPVASRPIPLRLARVGLAIVTTVFAAVVVPLALMFASIDNDRVLFVDLRGFHPDPEQPPADPGAVLDGFLRLLGVPAHLIPHDLPARSEAFRHHLSGTRALLLLAPDLPTGPDPEAAARIARRQGPERRRQR